MDRITYATRVHYRKIGFSTLHVRHCNHAAQVGLLKTHHVTIAF
ncbi:Uncharacterised protein [Vibrio cholerae]|nr:Uncharacterised protein [Vibrio cholerae]